MTFLNGRAVQNRTAFRDTLLEVGACAEKKKYLVGLSALVEALDNHNPCLRLSLLQYIMALDHRWNLTRVKESCRMALEMIGNTFSE